jgi:Asp-tRNA(Asn)/Glu-tRNA(Gln) amidotransferase A subunit family amidase
MKGEELKPLHGVPFSVKDLVFTKGVRTTFGCKLLGDFVPEEDAVHVARLKEAGAIMLGKTNTSEFGFKPLTDNLIFGITRNPWNLEMSPGGSSGGAAAAVASGLGPLAVGADGGGSIRIPSSCCGVFGIKPQHGRVPRYPANQGGEIITHEDPITRTVKDAALMLDIMAGTNGVMAILYPHLLLASPDHLTAVQRGSSSPEVLTWVTPQWTRRLKQSASRLRINSPAWVLMWRSHILASIIRKITSVPSLVRMLW